MNIKLTYEIGSKSSVLEKEIDAATEDEAHEAAYPLFLRWFKYISKNELDMTEQEKTEKRDKWEQEFFESVKLPYEKAKFLEKK